MRTKRAVLGRGIEIAVGLWVVSAGAAAAWGGSATLQVPADHATIQAAIDAAGEGDQILVAPGIYAENLDLSGKAVHLLGTGGALQTTIQGAGGVVVTIASGEGAGTVVEGFTITGGNGTTGSGIKIQSASPVIRDCTLTDNQNQSLGGGIVTLNGAAPRIEGCLFTLNSSERGGGIGGSQSSAPFVVNCTFRNNLAQGVIGEGGAFYFGTLSPGKLVNCLIYDNVARIGGAGKVRSSSDAELVNCTITRNIAHLGTGGFFNSASFPKITNTILWGNLGGNYQGYANTLHDQDGGTTTAAYSVVEEGFAGVAVLDLDPGFADATASDLRLALGSACIDAGDSSQVPAGLATDVAGLARMQDDPNSADTGVGSPVVDLGAHEAPPFCGPDGGAFIYCQAKLNSLGCSPAIDSVGTPAIGPSAGSFDIQCTNVLSYANGLFFYGYLGRAQITFFGGTLCVAPPTRRTTIQNAGGLNPPPQDCTGTFSYDFGGLLASGTDPFLVPGQQVNGQYWYRDPNHFDLTGTGLSNAIEFLICTAP